MRTQLLALPLMAPPCSLRTLPPVSCMERDAFSLLFPSSVMHVSLAEVLPYNTVDSLAAAVLEDWRLFKSHAEEDASGHALNSAFFQFQKTNNGEYWDEATRGWMTHAAVKDLLGAIAACTTSYLDKVDSYAGRAERQQPLDPSCFHLWASVHQSDSFHPQHVHPGAICCGVFYVRTPRGSGAIEFADPRGQVPPFERTVAFAPRAGD